MTLVRVRRTGAVVIKDPTTGERAIVDPEAKAVSVIPTEHFKVHEGRFFSCVDYDADVDTGAPKWWLIEVPEDDTIEYHTTIQVSADQAFLIQIYVGISASANGDELSIKNNDGNSLRETSLKFYKDPTNPSGGAVVFNDSVGANNPKARFGGTMRNGAEIVLKRGTKYGIKITPTNDDTGVSLVGEFYEVSE